MSFDLIGVGGGYAGLCAALAAREGGPRCGLFYYDYPGGGGLMAGAVFGKIAGEHAAAHSQRVTSA